MRRSIILILGIFLVMPTSAHSGSEKKLKMLVVSSYHREYLWSQETNEGFCTAMKKLGYFDNEEQIKEYTQNDYIETSKVILKKLWMDSKRKSTKSEKMEITVEFTQIAKEFQPDIIFLGDDDATNFIGNQFLNTSIPVIFWGVNNTPVKYGLVDSIEKPGHNVTGVYQAGYYTESLNLLKELKPNAKTFAILSDDTPTGRSHMKAIEFLAAEHALPLQLVDAVATNNHSEWTSKVLELQQKVDAFFVAHYASLKDDEGVPIPTEKTAKWYVENIKIPEAVNQLQFVKEGLLCGVDDSAYNQGFEAVVIAHDILTKGLSPANYPSRAPMHGDLMLNKQRAEALGMDPQEYKNQYKIIESLSESE